MVDTNKTRNTRPLLSCAVLPALLLLALLLNGCNRDNAQAAGAAAGPPPAVVSVTSVTVRDVPLYIDEIGRTTATEMVTIQPQVSGRISEIHFSDGAELKKNDLLFVIDKRPFQASLDQAQAQLAQSQAQLEYAVAELSRVTGLTEKGVVSREEFDQKRNAVDVGKAQVEAAKAAVETAQVNLDYCTITAPIDGRAGHRLVDPGNVVNSGVGGPNGGTSLLTIQKISPIYADFTVTEKDLRAVRQNMAAGTLKTLVWLPEDPDHPAEGELTFLDNAVQDGSGTIQLRATLKNANREFWPGQFVRIRLILSQIKDAILVPQTAPQVGQMGHYVFVVKPDSTAEMRLVELGQTQGDLIVVSKGLNPDEKVIIKGQMTVMPGAKVMPMPSSNATAQAASSGGA